MRYDINGYNCLKITAGPRLATGILLMISRSKIGVHSWPIFKFRQFAYLNQLD